MNRKIISEFNLWGSRKYVHGSHILKSTLLFLDTINFVDIKSLSLNFKHPLTTQAQIIVCSDHTRSDHDSIVAHGKVQSDTMTAYIFIKPVQTNVTEILPDNELELICSATFFDNGASISEYDITEWPSVAIILGKHLLIRSIPASDAPWMLTSIQINPEIFRKRQPTIHVKNLQTISNTMCRASIFADNIKCGSLSYIRRKSWLV